MNPKYDIIYPIRFVPVLLIIALLINISACEEREPKTEEHGVTLVTPVDRSQYPNPDILADPAWLMENMGRDDLVIVDIRETDDVDQFIAGAVSLSGIGPLLDGSHEVDSYIIGPGPFAELMEQLGISNDSKVVIYDEGTNLYAARLFYALDLYGHDNMMLLNGGFTGWTEQNGPVSDEPGQPQTATYQTDVNEAVFCDLETIQAAMHDENTVIFDVRSEDQFRGEWVRAERGGHIPGAVNLVWDATIHNPDYRVSWFRSPEDIALQYKELGITPDKNVIPHCHTNLHGSHAYFVLRLMGYDSVRAYEGSWAEYGNVDGVPVGQ